MTVFCYNIVCLTDKGTIDKLIVVCIFRNKIQIKIWVPAKNIPGTRNNLQEQFRNYRRSLSAENFFILENNFR